MEGLKEAEALLRKARAKLRSAKLLLDAGELEDAVSRAYYAAFSAARAVLLLVGEEPTTHSGVAFRLWFRFVERGLLEREYARVLNVLREAREEGDYASAFTLSEEEVTELIEDSERFVKRMEKLSREIREISERSLP